MINKITNQELLDNGHMGISGDELPEGADVKEKLDQLPRFVANRLNSLIDLLSSTAGGNNSGADNIGSAPVAGVTGANVRAQIASLKAIIDGLVLDEAVIPDGSLIKDKFANWNSDVVSALLTGYSLPELSGDLTSLDTLLQALGKLERALKDLSAGLVGIINGDTAVPKSKNVTEEINGVPLGQIFENDGKTVKLATHANSSTSSTNAQNAINATNAVNAQQSVTKSTGVNDTSIATTAFVHNVTNSKLVLLRSTPIRVINNPSVTVLSGKGSWLNRKLLFFYNYGWEMAKCLHLMPHGAGQVIDFQIGPGEYLNIVLDGDDPSIMYAVLNGPGPSAYVDIQQIYEWVI